MAERGPELAEEERRHDDRDPRHGAARAPPAREAAGAREVDPGAEEAVRALAARWPLGLASSSNRELIDLFLELAGFGDAFRVTVSSEEVARGKPSPDVYLEAASRLGVDAARCVAIEDSSNGIRAGHAAGMAVIAVPNPHYPPADDALALAAATVDGVAAISPELVASLR